MMGVDGTNHDGPVSTPFVLDFLDIASEACDSIHIAAPEGRVCIFCSDMCYTSCLAISDLADHMAGAPIVTVPDGRVPGWVGPGACIIFVSASGDCPHVVDAYREVVLRGCEPVCITSGGELADMADRIVIMDSGLDTFGARAFVLGALCAIITSAGAMDARSILDKAITSIRSEGISYDYNVPTALKGGVVAVYSTSDIRAASRGWADSIADVIGFPVFCSEFPEFDHNELVGWSDSNIHSKNLRMVALRSDYDGTLVSDIIACMIEVLQENGRLVTVVDIGGGDPLVRDIRSILIGECVARDMGVSE